MEKIIQEKQFIKNRDGKKISVVVEQPSKQVGLAFIMHGLGGFKEQKHIRLYAETFFEKGYTVVTFDTRNTIGESEGKMEDATISNYVADLEDVIQWASTQKWYQEPFVLAGHSAGSFSVLLYAEKYPEKVKALAPTSTVVNGKTSVDAFPGDLLSKWKETGLWEKESTSKPGVMKRIKYEYIEDKLLYDALKQADKLTMPVLLIVGDKDFVTPLKHHELLLARLSGKKELHVIKGAEHTFRDSKHLEEIKGIFEHWIDSL
jgi:pimeloyl-ACP methyl ester carboxylesterase